ncbi:MAG: GtrA family protein [Bacteroidales bacterium]|nr:GtrA family protein [Bacteroidales bacterium]
MAIDKLLIYKFLKYAVVGFSGLFVDFGVTYLFKEKAKINKYVSNALGFVCAATSNYILNRLWTFQSTNEDVATEYGSFMIVSAIGLGINSLVLWLLTDKFKWNFYVSKIFAIGCATLWNFFANLLFTFN